MINRKMLLAGIGLFGVIVLLAVTFSLVGPRGSNDSDTPDAAEPTLASNQSSQTVSLTNAADFATWLKQDNLNDAEKALYEKVAQYTDSPETGYEGTIRRDTFKTTHHDYESDGEKTKVPLVEYVVDIPTIAQSYRVSDAGGSDYPYHIIYVLCVDTTQQKYDDFGCKDEE